MWLLYQLLMAAALVLAAPVLLLRRGRHYLPTLRGRLGLANRALPDRSLEDRGGRKPAVQAPGRPDVHDVWLHAVSVGEVGVAATLAHKLPEELSVLVTTVTPTGQTRAAESLSTRATIAYLPFDLGLPIRRFFAFFRPTSLILVESELWPLLLRQCQKRGLAVCLVNGRISDRSFRRMRAVRPLLATLFRPIHLFAVQTPLDRDRYLALGAPSERVVVTGNLKYDSPEPSRSPELERRIERLARGRPILVAGSTMDGEENQVLDAFAELGGGKQALLILAARHPERFDSVAEVVLRHGLGLERRSSKATDTGIIDTELVDVLLLDSLGELSALYRLADAAFIGGTMVATGGHNPLEAARFGIPIAVGPSMENFRQIAEHFDRSHAWQRVETSRELALAWADWLEDPAQAAALGHRAQELFEINGGALGRTLELVAPFLPRRAS